MAGTQQNLIDAMYDSLTAVSGLSGSVYVEQAPQDADNPYLVLALVDDQPERYFEGSGQSEDLTRATFQVSIFDRKVNGSASARALGEKVFRTLENVKISVSGFGGAYTVCTNRGTMLRGGLTGEDLNYFQLVQTYLLQAQRTV